MRRGHGLAQHRDIQARRLGHAPPDRLHQAHQGVVPSWNPANVPLNPVPHPEDIREFVIHTTSEGASPANQTLINNYRKLVGRGRSLVCGYIHAP